MKSLHHGKPRDNQNSAIKDILESGIEDLGGYQSEVFNKTDVAEQLTAAHKKMDTDSFNLKKAQESCVKVPKIKEILVNEKSSVRELNIAILMTDWQYISSIYVFRGNALMASKLWINAIEDYMMAIYHGYDKQVFRVYHKIGQCQVKRKQYLAATDSFKLALDNLKNSKDELEKTKKDFIAILTECIKKFSTKKDEAIVIPKSITTARPTSVDPRISDLVEIMEEVGKGRTSVAKSSIPVGTVLAVDDGIGPHLNPDNPQKTLQYCLHCLKNVTVPYPCVSCPRVVFCSQKCQLESLGYHKYQCTMDLYSLRGQDTKDGCSIFSPLSVLLTRPASWWLDHQTDLLLPSQTSDWPTSNNNDLDQMTNLFSMATNESSVTEEVSARHTMVTLLLLRAIRSTSYYKDSNINVVDTGPLTKEELVLGKLIYRLRMINDMNAHPIWGAENYSKDKTNVGTEVVGGGLYTAIASYFNSDCNPNTIRVNIGRQMILIAAKNIRKGEEVTDNYCAHYSDMSCQQRRNWMRDNFLFHCECEACERDWPTYNNLPSSRPPEKVSDKLVELEMDYMTAVECGNHDKAIQSQCKEISLIQSNLSEPHQLAVTVRSSYIASWWRKVAAIITARSSEPGPKSLPTQHYLSN